MNTDSHRRSVTAWRWDLFDGLVGIATGVVAIALRDSSELRLAILLGTTLLVQGIAQLVSGWALDLKGARRGWLVVFGVLTVFGAVTTLSRPLAGVASLTTGLTVWFVAAGINNTVEAVKNSRPRLWNTVSGVASIAVGALVIAGGHASMTTVATLAGVGFLLRGVAETILAVKSRPTSSDV